MLAASVPSPNALQCEFPFGFGLRIIFVYPLNIFSASRGDEGALSSSSVAAFNSFLSRARKSC